MNDVVRIIILVVTGLATVLFLAQWYYTSVLNNELSNKHRIMRVASFSNNKYVSALKALVPATVFLIALSIAPTVNFTNFNGLEIAQIQSEDDLRSLLAEYQNSNNPLVPGLERSVMEASVAVPSPSPSMAEFDSAGSFTETNVQVVGVDEIDNIKTDGTFIYHTRYNQTTFNQEVVIYQAWPAEELSVYRTFTYRNDMNCYESGEEFCVYESPQGLYVDEDRLIIIISRNIYPNWNLQEGEAQSDVEDSTFRILPWYGETDSETVVYVYDKASDFTLVDEYTFEGYMVGTRKINDNLFVINSNWIYEDKENLLPRYSVNGESFSTEYNDIIHLRDTNPNNFTSIYGIDLITTDVDAEQMLQSSSNIMYVSQNNIYLLDQRFFSMPRMALFIDEGVNVDEAVTRVTRFELEGNNVSLAAAGEFLGYPLNQFSMDEQDGFLRVTTTTGWGEDTNNRLIVLNENMTIVSSLEKLGKPNERLQSTRFVGDRAYLVTFEMTDPFYVIDLSVPESPVILGELEITGFSSYLQPLDASHILGIGFEADTDGRTTGLKLAIYDVSDPANPIENSKSVIEYDEFGWSFSSSTYNHKDLLVDYDKQVIGFPFNTYNYDETTNTYGYETGYMIYSFEDLELTRLAYINHEPDRNYNQMEKGLFLDDYLYTVSTNQLGVSELSNLSEFIKLLKTQ